MDPKAQLAAAGLSPEQIEQVMAIMGGAAKPADAAAAPPSPPPAADTAAAPAAPMPMSDDMMKKCMAFGDDPKATEDQKMMSALARGFSEMSKQVGAVNKFAEDAQKGAEAAKFAAFSAACEEKVKTLRTKLEPALIEKLVTPAITEIGKAKTFSSESDRLTAFSAIVDRYAALPDDPRLKSTPRPAAAGADGKPVLSDGQLATLNTEAYRRSSIGGAVRAQLLPKVA